MQSRTDNIMKALNFLAWVIFIGLCIQAGGFIFNAFFVLFVNPVGANKFWTDIDLGELYQFSYNHFVIITGTMIIVSLLKALMFYIIVKIFHDKKLDFNHPFNETLGRYLSRIAYLSFMIALFSYGGYKVTVWLATQGIAMPSLQSMQIGGADVWFLMSITLFVFAQIYRKGMEIKSENDLTV